MKYNFVSLDLIGILRDLLLIAPLNEKRFSIDWDEKMLKEILQKRQTQNTVEFFFKLFKT